MLLLFQIIFFAPLFPIGPNALLNRKTSCDSFFFRVNTDYILQNHVIATRIVVDELECQLSCLSNATCQSFNVLPNKESHNRICELNNVTRHDKPADLKWKKGSTYFNPVQVSCVLPPRDETENKVVSSKCHPDYKGKNCLLPILGRHCHLPAHSCKHIQDSGDSGDDGEYWIDPEKTGNPLKVFCDMTTQGGGWVLVYNVVINSSAPVRLTAETTFHGIENYHSNRMILSPSAMKQLRDRLHFTQMRFHCSKPSTQRTFHVLTVANSSGEAVVSFFCLQTNVFPKACGSYKKLDGDDSYLASNCSMWGRENSIYYVGKWGHDGETSLSNFPAFIRYHHHWATSGSRFECDDYRASPIGTWKIFVR